MYMLLKMRMMSNLKSFLLIYQYGSIKEIRIKRERERKSERERQRENIYCGNEREG